MSIGYNTIMRLNRAERNAKSFGFRFGPSRIPAIKRLMAELKESPTIVSDDLSVYPDEDALPNYTRDAELFNGDLTQVESFLAGVLWSKQYLTMLGLVSDLKIERKEQNVRNKKLLALLSKVD